jgi:hypothetical protein
LLRNKADRVAFLGEADIDLLRAFSACAREPFFQEL